MTCFLRVLTFVSILLRGVSAGEGNNFLKPSFVPYCAIKEECQSDCSCKSPPGCTIGSGLKEEERNEYLKAFNMIRQIQTLSEPEPSGMTELKYDMELEEISKCSALMCPDKHSTCFTTPKFQETSQSVLKVFHEKFLTGMSVATRLLGGVKLSAEMLINFPAGKDDENIHNFAQILSDRILAMACTWRGYPHGGARVVCSYGPRGAIPGEPIYKIGPVCSTCPEGYACDYKEPFSRLCKKMNTSHSVATSVATTPPAPPPLPAIPNVTPPLPPPRGPSPLSKTPLIAPPKIPPFQTVQSCPPNFPPPTSLPKVPPSPPSRRPHISPSTIFP